jgi:hypothetical protein
LYQGLAKVGTEDVKGSKKMSEITASRPAHGTRNPTGSNVFSTTLLPFSSTQKLVETNVYTPTMLSIPCHYRGY